MAAAGQKKKASKDTQDILTVKIEKEATLLADYLLSKLPKQTGKKDKFYQNTVELFANCLNDNFLRLYGLYFTEDAGSKQNVQENTAADKDGTLANFGFNSAYIVRYIFKDNLWKPKTVRDLKLSVNIPELVFIPNASYYESIFDCIIKDVICTHIQKEIDKVIGKIEAKPANSAKMKNDLIKKIAVICDEITANDFSKNDISGKISTVMEKTRISWFNYAVQKLAQMLEKSGLSFQFIDVIENGFNVLIKEYEDNNLEILPDENYKIHLRYYNKDMILNERLSYNEQNKKLLSEARSFWDLIEVIYQDSKPVFKASDYNDLLNKNKNRIIKMIGNFNYSGEKLYEDQLDFSLMRSLINKMKDNISKGELKILENKLTSLENKYLLYCELTNPNRVQAGLLIELDIRSIKNRNTSILLLSDVLNKFTKNVLQIT